MITIYKYPMSTFPFMMPRGAKILLISKQDGIQTLWAEVDNEAPMVERTIIPVPTGGMLPQGEHKYVGTIFEGPLVIHLFDYGED